VTVGLEENLPRVRDGIEAAARRAGRDPGEVTLVAVTKTLPPEVVARAAGLGVADFGENYANELAAKRDAAPQASWHFIGALQSHAANRVADLADVVHSGVPGRALDRLAARAASRGRTLPLLVQIDEAGRGTAVRPEDAGAAVQRVLELEGVDPVGLMSLPPPPAAPEDSRPYFVRLREIRDELRKRFEGLVELSMGMSLDYEIAVEEGATIVRVGTALFGIRPEPAPEQRPRAN
jgi:pyridoxal phosphate enzyme (YggS family)